MIRKNKGKLFISSLIILLPALMGIFIMPLVILAVHWFCIFVTSADPKNKNQSPKAFRLIFWVCPAASLFSGAAAYAAASDIEFGADLIFPLLIGLMFIVGGNYLPKCRQNYTLGIKIKWTLENEENWNATHRLCGKVWVIGGFLLMISVFLPQSVSSYFSVIIMLTLVVVPIVYSYVYHKKQLREGCAEKSPLNPPDKRIIKITAYLVLVIFIFTGILLFTGSIRITYDNAFFIVNSVYWSNLTIDYDQIDSIEYRNQSVDGRRTNGFGNFRLQMGAFKNNEFGSYTRYTYTQCDACVVLSVDGKTVVLSGSDAESTQDIYDQLADKL